MTGLWIAVAIFAVFAIGAGLTQILFFRGDRKNASSVQHERERLHPDPTEPVDQPNEHDRRL